MLKTLKISKWRQFDDLQIDFDKRLTILTGANGAGKTTLLNILSHAAKWSPSFISSYENEGTYTNSTNEGLPSEAKKVKIGSISFDRGKEIAILLPTRVNSTYGIEYSDSIDMPGIFLSAYRPIFSYRKLESIPVLKGERREIFDLYKKFNENFTTDRFRDVSKDTDTGIGIIKSSLIALCQQGQKSDHNHGNPKMAELFDGYCQILKHVLPEELKFQDIEINSPEVILRTGTGSFVLDAMSGGIASIVDITWQLFMYAEMTEPFTAIIDEPENHLHPKLQRDFMANLVNCFPHVQFVIATHNPFMISAVKESKVYVLDYHTSQTNGKVDIKVKATDLDEINKAGSSNDILKEVLGVRTSVPSWAEREVEEIVEEFTRKPFTIDTINELRRKMTSFGFADYIPEAITRVVERTDDKVIQG